MKRTAIFAALSLLLTGSVVIGASEGIEQEPDLTQAPTGEIVEDETSKRWVCKGCTDVENKVLKALQDQGITDKNALAVVMGNIKQESRFVLDICEGGQRTGYDNCHHGGFGLIQWTTESRYDGLGELARQYQLDPNSLDAQLQWLFTEREWKKVEHIFQTPGKTQGQYMNAAYKWLGWGVHGARTTYANQYVNLLHLE